jgi:hypothetical protein
MSHDQTWTAGQVLTAAAINDLTSGRVGYVAVTSSQGSITSVVDLTSLTVTFTAIASRYYRITGHVMAQNNTANARCDLQLTDGSNNVLAISRGSSGATNQDFTLIATYIVAPGAGSVTYKLRAVANSGTMQMTAAATAPAFISVEDFGSS